MKSLQKGIGELGLGPNGVDVQGNIKGFRGVSKREEGSRSHGPTVLWGRGRGGQEHGKGSRTWHLLCPSLLSSMACPQTAQVLTLLPESAEVKHCLL